MINTRIPVRLILSQLHKTTPNFATAFGRSWRDTHRDSLLFRRVQKERAKRHKRTVKQVHKKR